MTDILSKADRDVWREQCAPLSPGIVQPTADAMVIALCAHADAMDALLDECAEVLRQTAAHGSYGPMISALIAKLKGR